jgi:hypothetical protein
MEKFRGGMWFSAETGWILQDFGKNRRSPLFQKKKNYNPNSFFFLKNQAI